MKRSDLLQDPARLDGHEGAKVGHDLSSADAMSAPMQLREVALGYGSGDD